MMDSSYIDGLFDGEGCVYWDGRGVRVSITNTYKPVLMAIKSLYGGSVRCMDRKVWRWEASGETANTFLEDRDCTIKASQVEVALDILWFGPSPKTIAVLKHLKKQRFSK